MRFLVWFLVALWLGQPGYGQDVGAVYVQVSKGTDKRTGSGFLWKSQLQVVTSLHVVAGSDRIVVAFDRDGKRFLSRAHIERVLVSRDLALLSLEKPLGNQDVRLKPLTRIARDYRKGEALEAYGYPQGIEEPGPTPLRARTAKAKIMRRIVPKGIKAELASLGFPDLNQKVIDLDGHLLPGDSGAPIVNAGGALVGIAMGGLDLGHASRSWAVPATALKDLMTATDQPPTADLLWQRLAGLFGVSQPSGPFFIDDAMPFPPDQGYLNILILPFAPLQNCTIEETHLEETIKRRLLEMQEAGDLKLRVKFYQGSGHCPQTYAEAEERGRAFGANLVIWGDTYEFCGDKDEACLKYVVVDQQLMGVPQRGQSASERFHLPEITQGKLQKDVDYIIYWTLGWHAYREVAYRKALYYFNQVPQEGEGDYSAVLNVMGMCHLYLGNYPTSRELFVEVLTKRREDLGDEHADTLTAMGNLANTLEAQGDLAGARRLGETTLEARTRILGEEHPATLITMGNLAGTLFAQGDLTGARRLQEKVLEADTRILGEEHPGTLTAMVSLAGTLFAQGDLTDARRLEEKALEARTRILGEEHPRTLTSMGNLAGTLKAQGDLTGARRLEEKALEARMRILGEEHPDTLTDMVNLAGTLKAQGDLTGARPLLEKALMGRTRILGEEHPDTLAAMGNLAGTLNAQGDLTGARRLQEKVLEADTRILGEEHPDTLIDMVNLAGTLKAQGDLTGARRLQETALAAKTRLLGAEHPNTLTAMVNLAGTLKAQGDLTGARSLQEKALEARTRILGPRHSDTTISIWNLLNIEIALQNHEKAVKLLTEILWLLETDDQALSWHQQTIKGYLGDIVNRGN